MECTRRDLLSLGTAGVAASAWNRTALGESSVREHTPLKITGLKVTPIALPDPPLLAAGGCHGPYFLRNVVQLETDAGIIGIGETRGGERLRSVLEKARPLIVGKNAFAYRAFAKDLMELSPACFAGIELACLDACGRATGRRLCELLGGPVLEQVEVAAYLFFRYAADHPKLLADSRIADARGRGDRALDAWGEVRSPESMAEMAVKFREQFGFRVFKLKAGVLDPRIELETLQAIYARLGDKALLRIDPNGRWTVDTAVRVGQQLRELPLEYYEDPVRGQSAMADVRRDTRLPMSTNMCVTRFEHIPDALRLHPVDVVLADHHYWGGMIGCLALGQFCESVGWKVSQHSNSHSGITMAAMIHLGATMPQLTLASDTHYPWLVESADIIAGGKLPIRNGRMSVPTKPGLGVDLDLDKLARAHEVYRQTSQHERDDAETMRLVMPDWKPFLF